MPKTRENGSDKHLVSSTTNGSCYSSHVSKYGTFAFRIDRGRYLCRLFRNMAVLVTLRCMFGDDNQATISVKKRQTCTSYEGTAIF